MARHKLARERSRASIGQASQQAVAASPNLSPSQSLSLRMYVFTPLRMIRLTAGEIPHLCLTHAPKSTQGAEGQNQDTGATSGRGRETAA